MLFNSLLFLLVFLPVAGAAYALVMSARPAWRSSYLLVVSLVFYGWFDARFVVLLGASILVNWWAARIFARVHAAWSIAFAIAIDLVLLGIYKYLDFLADLASALQGIQIAHLDLALPIGLSFLTFQHVSYLVDLKRGRIEPAGLLDYALYIAFFPKVIAGPLVRAGEFLPQLHHGPPAPGETAERVGRGLLLLTAGLGKKVLLGDMLAGYVNPIYAAVAAGHVPTLSESWLAAFGYTFQLYFDFSGYTDMALGIALLFGIVLPQNFDAPYRSVSIQDFWRRWHITLSFFLRDYLYISFGGNRHGLPRQVFALFATMVLGGLWHGAGLTFVAWGAAHGAALCIHLLWRKAGRAMPNAAGFLLTFLFVVLAWVLFRAPSFGSALAVYKGLVAFGRLGDGLPVGPLAVAAVVAMVGPTAWEMVVRCPPARWVAVAVTLVVVVLLLKVGDDANYAFIYARF